MNSLLKKIVLLPFVILDRFHYNGESLLWRCVRTAMKDDAKFRLGKHFLFERVTRQKPLLWHQFEAYFNAICFGSNLADAFAANLISDPAAYESQIAQDCFVDTIFEGKTGGVFVEIGVGEGRVRSNTYFFEKYRKWTGVLCEPSTNFHESIRKNRKAVLVPKAVYDRSGLDIGFIEVIGNEEHSTLSGQVITDSHDRTHARNYTVATISFNDLCKEYLNGKRIDYLSVDTEGSELTILHAVDFENIEISVISVEHNFDQAKRREMVSFLEQFGYVEVLDGVFEFDSMFVKRALLDKINARLADDRAVAGSRASSEVAAFE